MLINGKTISIARVYKAVVDKEKITIAPQVLNNLAAIRKKITTLLERKKVIYGVNTGFGALKTQSISFKDINALQKNLIVSHAVGVGKPFSQGIVRAIMLLMLNSLCKGYSGVRPIIVETLAKMINKGVYPIVPEKGSVGSSGDLAPSAHIVLVLIGKGEAFVNGKIMLGEKAMKLVGITPIVLEAKEGLALINNTFAMTACAIFALASAKKLVEIADICGGLSAEALQATADAFDERIHDLKPHKGQITTAARMRALLKKSTMVDISRIQDQYSIRCIPQVHGAIREAIAYAKAVVTTEINSVTDNPLVFSKGDSVEIISGGNFHGEPVAIAMDSLRIAIAELANISDRRIASMLDSNHNFGLPAFLAKNPGVSSGMMILQYTTAALVSENKILTHPASVDSVPTSANIEDHVSMGTIAARKTLEVLENVTNVLAIELLVSCQAIDFRLQKGKKLGIGSAKAYLTVRKEVPFFENDTQYMGYVTKIVEMMDKISKF